MRCPLNPGQRQPRRGVVAVLVALCLVVLLAAVGLAMDGGAVLAERRHAQETADAAALAAADDLFQHYPLNLGSDSGNSAVNSAKSVASANGYTTGVTVNVPGGTYSGGPHAGRTIPPGYAEVTVTAPVPLGFGAMAFGRNTATVHPRAVARGLWVPPNPQIIVFDLSQVAALGVGNQTQGSITVQGGPVVVNSNAASAANNTTRATFTDNSGFLITGTIAGNFTGPKTSGARPTPDPLAYLPPPGGLSVQSASMVSYDDTHPPPNPLPAGIYQGGIFVSGSVSLTLQPGGIYYIKGGGFYFTSLGTLTGLGVMIYNEPAGTSGLEQVYIDGNDYNDVPPPPPSKIKLSPLTSGPYQGLTIFQARTAIDQVVLNGNGNTNITGTVYAANANAQVSCIAYNGNSDLLGTDFMVRTMLFGGSSNLLLPINPQPTKQRLINLVE